MFSKISNKQLGTVFAVLLIIVLIIWYSDANKAERSFRQDLVSIDTASVSKIVIFPKTKSNSKSELFKEKDFWLVKLPNGEDAPVQKRTLESLFSTLQTIKSKRLASRDENNWNKFEVTDSMGTRVQVFEGSDKTLDIYLGKFSFQQPRSMNTYVRLANDTDVYEVEGFLSATFNKSPKSFRDNRVISSSKTKWKSLSFDYLSGPSFKMDKLDEGWHVNTLVLDSAKTEKYLNGLQRLTGNKFAETDGKGNLGEPTHKLTISGGSEDIIVKGYLEDEKNLIHSSLNPETVFDSKELADKIFIDVKSLTK